MIKFLVPAAAAATGGNAGALAGATVGAAVATGAVIATGGPPLEPAGSPPAVAVPLLWSVRCAVVSGAVPSLAQRPAGPNLTGSHEQ